MNGKGPADGKYINQNLLGPELPVEYYEKRHRTRIRSIHDTVYNGRAQFMETATKNRRGRPKNPLNELYEQTFNDLTPRAAQNTGYASTFIVGVLHQMPGDFFITEKGKFRRQGIAERIGRLHDAGKLTDEQATDLANAAIEDYQNGKTVKEIEQNISAFAKSYLN